MTEARFLDFLAAWQHRDLDAVVSFLDEQCVYEPAVSSQPGYTAVGREAVRQILTEQFAAEVGEFLVAAPFSCGPRGMLEWTAFQCQANGHPILQRGCDWFEFPGDQIRRISSFRKVEHPAEHPLDKSALLAHIRASYDRFQARLAPLSEAQMTTPGALGTWSVKEVLAHLTAWHEMGAKEYQAIARGQQPHIEPEGDVDQENARLIEPYHAQSPAQVQAAFRTFYQQVVAAVESLSEADLFETDRFPWREGHALWEGIAYNTFAHYDEHGPMLQVWIDSAR